MVVLLYFRSWAQLNAVKSDRVCGTCTCFHVDLSTMYWLAWCVALAVCTSTADSKAHRQLRDMDCSLQDA